MVSTNLANKKKKDVLVIMSLQNVNVMSKLEAHSLDFILSFLDKWTKDNMQQEVWYRGVYIPNENISILQLRALEILRS